MLSRIGLTISDSTGEHIRCVNLFRSPFGIADLDWRTTLRSIQVLPALPKRCAFGDASKAERLGWKPKNEIQRFSEAVVRLIMKKLEIRIWNCFFTP